MDATYSDNTFVSRRGVRSLTPDQLLVLLLAIGQAVSPGLVTLSGRQIGDSGGLEPLLVPSGYTFIVWSPIVAGSLAFAIYQALPAQTHRSFYPSIRRPAVLVFTGFTLWLIAAVQNWLWVTVLVFIGMLLALWRILPPILAERSRWTAAERFFVALPFSLYAGWTTIAIFANLASALSFYGVSPSGVTGLSWQVILLIAATANAIIGIRRTGGDLPYTGVLFWALAGIVHRNLLAPPTPPLPPVAGLPPTSIIATLAGIAAGVLIAVTVFVRRTRSRT